MRIFVGNLAKSVSDEALQQAVAAFGEVVSATVTRDEAGASKGHGLVEMASKEAGQAVLDGLNGQELDGQAVKLSEARPEQNRGGAKKGGWSGPTGKGGGNQGRGPSRAGGSKGGFTMGKTTGHKV